MSVFTLESDPEQDARAFRNCLGRFASGVTVITTMSDGKPVGLTANSFSAVSLSPPLILWSLGRSSRSFDAFSVASHFNINILASNQIGISQTFASKSEDKFAGIDWSPGIFGTPIIEGAVATLECRAETAHEVGDHLLFIGRVKRCLLRDQEGLVFVQGRYGVASEHPDLVENPPAASMPEESLQSTTLSAFVHRVHHGKERAFETERRKADLTLTENKLLSALYGNDGRTPGELTNSRYFGRLELQDALTSLEQRGYIYKSSDKVCLSERGISVRKSLIEHVEKADRDLLSDISAHDIEIAKQVLWRVANILETAE